MAESVRMKPGSLLAFCHIEKTAGMSLTHILRRIFFLRYADIRPMHDRTYRNLTGRDLRTVLRINPFLLGIGGHSVVPHGDLMREAGRLAFITQLREPIARATSQFRYWVNTKIDESGPDAYLAHPASENLQVRKIAGCQDVELAKQKIRQHFLLAGTVERFDEFLVLLAKKLDMPLRLFTYRRKNVGRIPPAHPLPPDFAERLRQRNQLDQQLYEWAATDLYSEYVNAYPGDFQADLQYFRALQSHAQEPILKPYTDWVYRKGFLQPISGLIRLTNGLPYHGSYSKLIT